MKWEKVEFGELYLLPSKNGLNRPSRVRGSGYKMINMGELFAFDRIKDIPMELVPMNDREIETSNILDSAASLTESLLNSTAVVKKFIKLNTLTY